jgi:hypothetical protein
MNAFRTLLAAIFLVIAGYTAVVGAEHGWDLLAIFFGDIARMAWPGQFNLDFLSFLVLSGLWLSWRHDFGAAGLALGVCGFFGGGLFLSAYLLWASFDADGDMAVILLGRRRAAR